jgi:hypothetical protein
MERYYHIPLKKKFVGLSNNKKNGPALLFSFHLLKAQQWLKATPVHSNDVIRKPRRHIECILNQHIFCLGNEGLNKSI